MVHFAFAFLLLPQSSTPPPRLAPPPLDGSRVHSGATLKSGGRRGGRFSPPDGNDVQVSSSSTAFQDETAMRVDPSDRLHLAGGANDTRSTVMSCAFYASMDGGLTWSEFLYPATVFGGDPCVAIGPAGETYFGLLADRSIYVGRSYDGGLSVPTWVKVAAREYGKTYDRPQLAADTGSGALSGAVYVTWTQGENGIQPIYVSATMDGGLTWSPRTRLSDSDMCLGSNPAVGPKGEIEVVYYDLNDSSIKFDVSLDGGVTWGTDVKIADVPFFSKVPNTSFRVYPAAAIAVDTSGGPYDGTIYVCWTKMGTGQDTDVRMSRSTDLGVTWSRPIPVSDVTTNCQFMPWVDVDPNGNVNFGFYDRRDDPNDVRLNYYVSRSSDGGVTFQPNVRVSDVDFDPNSYSQGDFIGDFTAVAASDRTVHALWTDGRNGTDDVFTSRVQLDLHTDVSSISATTGGTANFTLNPGPLHQFSDYRILGSLSGTSPGIDFGLVNLSLNYDAFMLATFLDANSSALPGFTGTLDATGSAQAAVVSAPLPPALVGLQMDFAAFVSVGHAVRWASNPTHLEIVP